MTFCRILLNVLLILLLILLLVYMYIFWFFCIQVNVFPSKLGVYIHVLLNISSSFMQLNIFTLNVLLIKCIIVCFRWCNIKPHHWIPRNLQTFFPFCCVLPVHRVHIVPWRDHRESSTQGFRHTYF